MGIGIYHYIARLCIFTVNIVLNIPVFIAPSKLSNEQYSSVFDAVRTGGVIPLYMTRESAYCKAVLGSLNGLSGDELVEFMIGEINNEFI